MTQRTGSVETASGDRAVVYRHRLPVRLTHWIWVLCLFFLLASGLQIFNAHPALDLGNASQFKTAAHGPVPHLLAIGAEAGPPARGVTEIFGRRFDTTGLLGLSGPPGAQEARAFPAWATIPSFQDLATGRVVHFFFAWIFVVNFLLWVTFGLFDGHLRGDILPRLRDLSGLPRDVRAHLSGKLSHGRRYSPLQRLSYAVVLLVIFPGMIVTGLAMSPGFDAITPWLVTLLGGRQTARSLHFLGMASLVLFFVVHIVMVLLAGPLNEMRSILTGWYRTAPDPGEVEP